MRTIAALAASIVVMALAAAAEHIGTQEIQVADGDTIYANGKT